MVVFGNAPNRFYLERSFFVTYLQDMKCFKGILLILNVLLVASPSFSQNQENDKINDSIKSFKLTAMPVLFYLPETGLGYGALGIGTFRFRDEPSESYPSSIQMSISRTSKNQLLLWAPYELYWNDDKWRFFGELGFYKYFYNFYGVGIESQEESFETYEIDFPRLRASLLKEVLPSFLIGAGYELDIYYNLKFEENGTLDSTNVEGKNNAGTISNLGILAVYDTRDHIFQPSRGFFIQASAFTSMDILGSSFSFSKFNIDSRFYQKLKGKHILAVNAFMANTGEGTPFFSLNYLGTNNRSRGFTDRRYLDHAELSFALEYRFPIAGRFGGAAFGSSGTVSNDFSGLFSSRYRNAYGAGIRYTINKKDGIRVRVDYGASEEGGNLYFTVREAF